MNDTTLTMLFGWTFKEWAHAISWARATNRLTGGPIVSMALRIKADYEIAYGKRPSENAVLVLTPEDRDWEMAHETFMGMIAHMEGPNWPVTRLARMLLEKAP